MDTSADKVLLLKLEEYIESGHNLIKEGKLKKKLYLVSWVAKVHSLLMPLFGAETEFIKDIDLFFKEVRSTDVSADRFQQKLDDIEHSLNILKGIAGLPLSLPISQPCPPPKTKNVFVIHGHDELNTLRLSKLLQDHLGLKPIAILSKAGKSRPLIDKFEEEARTCSFAFALFTPDDHIIMAKEEYDQARPNVIYETGWFIGRLGRERLVILFKEGTKIHSDLDGVSRIQFREDINEKVVEIQCELQAAKLI